MSPFFAHELKQPLSSLSNYIGGLKIWNSRRNALPGDKALAEEALSAMAEETGRITAIVNRVRGYARKPLARRTSSAPLATSSRATSRSTPGPDSA